MLMNLYQRVTQTYDVFKVACYFFGIWPFATWIRFWMTRKPETVITINNIKVLIRTQNFFTKIADISMVYECIIRDDYGLKHLTLFKDGIILDIGGHIGSFSLAAAKQHPQMKILSFEPSPHSYRIFKKNVTINNYQNITVLNKAVSSHGEKVPIYHDSLNPAANSIYKSKGRCVEVPSISFKKIFQSNHIKKCTFLKMDCEGAEYDILLNAPLKLLRKIEAMVIEYHDPGYFGLTNKKYTLRNLVKHLEQAGFKCKINKIKTYQGMVIAGR